MENYGKIGTGKELEKKLFEYDEKKNNLLVVRAINDGELKQLLQDCPNNFKFHEGCYYLCWLGPEVKEFAELRSGTIVVTEINKKEFLGHVPDEGEDTTGKKLTGYVFGRCLVDFVNPVEVYNTKGLSWKDLEKNYLQ